MSTKVSSDPKTECLVYGVIRSIQSLFNIDTNPFNIIPNEVINICIAYYWMREYFELFSEEFMETNEDKTILKKKASGSHSGYGSVVISSISKGYHEWKFKILKQFGGFSVTIGIDNSEAIHTEKNFSYTKIEKDQHIKKATYALCSNGVKYSTNCKGSNYNDGKVGFRFNENDLVTMILDLDKATLTFNIESIKAEYLSDITSSTFNTYTFKDIEKREGLSYRMAIRLYYKVELIQLLEYSAFLK